ESGTIVIISAFAVSLNSILGCDPGNLTNSLETSDGLSAWADHIKSNGTITETPFDSARDGTLAATLALRCASIVKEGSGTGVCHCPGENGSPVTGVEPPTDGIL